MCDSVYRKINKIGVQRILLTLPTALESLPNAFPFLAGIPRVQRQPDVLLLMSPGYTLPPGDLGVPVVVHGRLSKASGKTRTDHDTWLHLRHNYTTLATQRANVTLIQVVNNTTGANFTVVHDRSELEVTSDSEKELCSDL